MEQIDLERNTERSPGCYHSMINYMAEQSGLSAKKTLVIINRDGVFEKRFNKQKQKHFKKLMYSSYNIQVNTSHGKVPYYDFDAQKRWDAVEGREFISYEVSVYRSIEEFGIETHNAGKYKDSLGGGWHSMTYLLRINDQYFAPQMECAHF